MAVPAERTRRAPRGTGLLVGFAAGAIFSGALVLALSPAQEARAAAPCALPGVLADRTVPPEWRFTPRTVDAKQFLPSARARARLGRPGQ